MTAIGSPDFSTVVGGPLYQLYLRTHIAKPPLDLLKRRILVISGIAWLPLLVLSLVGGRAWSGPKVPFLYDIETHVRFLLSLPLLIYAEVLVHKRLRPVIQQFIDRGIIPPECRASFDQIVQSTTRLRNSIWAEVVVIVVAVTATQPLWQSRVALRAATWYADVGPSGMHLTLAGIYFIFVSMTIYRLILFRWYYRVLLWFIFLLRVSRLDLKLIPTHPDRSGGLEFLQTSAYALTPVLVAQSLLVAGMFANQIFYTGAKLTAFRMEIVFVLLFLMLLALAPLLVFVPRIMQCRRDGLREYGIFASQYVDDFHQKWVAGRRDAGEQLLGTGDIQSLADLANSFEIIRSMNGLPFGRQAVVRLAVAILLPIAPLVLTMIPLNEIVDRLLKGLL